MGREQERMKKKLEKNPTGYRISNDPKKNF